MRRHVSPAIIASAALCCVVSCAQVSKRMPGELRQMHDFLTQDDPTKCRNYHYNFERQAPRLYREQQSDSILDIIEYIKTECGPAANLEVARLLLLANRGQFGDSLVGSATIPQMLWHRSEEEGLMHWRDWNYLFGFSQPIDNTHDNFAQFTTDLAKDVSSNAGATRAGQALGLFYSGAFDSAFSIVQSDDLRGTALRRNYDEFISRTKRMFPVRLHVGLLAGSWCPQNNASFLGKHPDIGLQMGGEGRKWRGDAIISYRFSRAKNTYVVDSLGHLVSTDDFDSWLFGLEGGFMFLNDSRFSTDLFVGVGYDVIYSVTKAGDPEKEKAHGSLGVSFGLRHRIFLDRRNGWYLGAIARYSIVDYSNRGGTDLSGNTLTISLVTGWSLDETLKQFLTKLNYKGDWRR